MQASTLRNLQEIITKTCDKTFNSFPAVKPTSRPTVEGFKPTYRVGDVLNMTCSLADTFPAANLTWFFSGDKVRVR